NPITLDQYVPATCDPADPNCTHPVPASVVPFGTPIYSGYLCPDNNNAAIAGRMATILGVTAVDQAIMNYQNCSATPGTIISGTADRAAAFEEQGAALFRTQTQTLGNLFNGNEASLRLDYNWNANNRAYVSFNWFKSTDQFGPCSAACDRGFT